MYHFGEGKGVVLEDALVAVHPDGEGVVDDDAVGDETAHLQVQGLVEHLGHLAVTEEIELLVEVPEEQGQEDDDGYGGHAPTKGQTHQHHSQYLSVVAFEFELGQFQLFFHLGLHFLPCCPAPAYFLHQAVEDGHGEGGVHHQDQGVEDYLVADVHVPVRHKVIILGQAIGVFLEVVVRDEEGDGFFEGHSEHFCLKLDRGGSTRRVTRTVVAT